MINIIGIAGESGVGKSNIAEIVSLFFGVQETTILSTDDLHKWERTSKMWNEITHLNPDANNLELGDMHLADLAQGKPIYRSVYNHKTGHFDPPTKIIPKATVIIEGLHAFYTETSKDLLGLKIFVDTDETLRVHWKIIRDTEERGYTYNSALDAINKRRVDSYKIRQAQMAIADVVIRLTTERPITHIGNRNEKIKLVTQIHFNNEVNKELFAFIETYIAEFNKFVYLSETIGKDLNMCQNGGGNISVKVQDYMVIKSSGFNLKDVYKLGGYSVVRPNIFALSSAEIFDELVIGSVVSEKYKRPSMETGFHSLLDKYVIHVHPIYLTTLLCLENSKELMKQLYSEYDYEYIPYSHPGYSLFEAIKTCDLAKKIFFLENHGIIISSNDPQEAQTLLADITTRAKNCLEKVIEHYGEFDLKFNDDIIESPEYLFPDATVFLNEESKKEIRAAHNYIGLIGHEVGTIRYLTAEQVHFLKNLESEKYRKAL